MTTFANTTVTPGTDGIYYAKGAVMPGAEADLFSGGAGYDPAPLPYEAAVVASVELSIAGTFTANTTYVVLQTDLGDGVWFDLAWCVWSALTGSANFLLSAGATGANAFQQTRAVGTAPASNGSNQCPLGGRIRFVGKSSLTQSSSSSGSPGNPGVTVTIKYKLTPLR